VVLQTHHREEDLAYPILIDPEVVYEDWQHPNWYENQRLGALSYWKWESNSGLISHPPESSSWPGHHGLFIGTPSGSLPGGIYGYNYLFRNLGSYIQNATINLFYRANHGCTAMEPYPEPYDYDALYDSAQGHYNETHFNDAQKLGNSQLLNWGHMFIEGMGTAAATSIPCTREVLAGGMELWWGDWDAPELTSVGAMPSGWIKMDNTQRTVSVSAYDGGLGVKTIRLFGLGREYLFNQSSCLGTLEEPCAASRSGTITYETSGTAAYEGEQTFTVQALDPVEHGYHSKQYPLKLDGLPPALTLSGQFTTATEPTGVDQLSLPTYNLNIKAKDLLSTGGTGSGVQKIKVFLDGKEVASSGPTCTSSSCPSEYEWTYPVTLTGMTEAEHTLEVRSSDFVGTHRQQPDRRVQRSGAVRPHLRPRSQQNEGPVGRHRSRKERLHRRLGERLSGRCHRQRQRPTQCPAGHRRHLGRQHLGRRHRQRPHPEVRADRHLLEHGQRQRLLRRVDERTSRDRHGPRWLDLGCRHRQQPDRAVEHDPLAHPLLRLRRQRQRPVQTPRRARRRFRRHGLGGGPEQPAHPAVHLHR
jgi:hypothetical protein